MARQVGRVNGVHVRRNLILRNTYCVSPGVLILRDVLHGCILVEKRATSHVACISFSIYARCTGYLGTFGNASSLLSCDREKNQDCPHRETSWKRGRKVVCTVRHAKAQCLTSAMVWFWIPGYYTTKPENWTKNHINSMAVASVPASYVVDQIRYILQAQTNHSAPNQHHPPSYRVFPCSLASQDPAI